MLSLVKFVYLFLFHCGLNNLYGTVYGQPTSTSSPSNQKCAVPATFIDKTVSYKCKAEAGKVCHKNGDIAVPQYTTAAFECKPGYEREDGKKFQSVCIDNEWQPPIDNCIKKCDKLNPISVDLRCTYRGSEIECDGNLLPGTKVRPTCKPLHTHEGAAPTYEEITCKQDGKWDHALFSCRPDCGTPFSNAEPLIAFGEPEEYGDSPWHVAIYNEKNVLICGGTIISPHLVATAAHCFYNENNATKSDPKHYEIIVSKVTRNYTTKDNGIQKNYKVKEIRYSKNGFVGNQNNYENNIALLILSEELVMGPTVMPACVDWSGTKKIPPMEGTQGKFVGWGKNANDTWSEILHTASLPFISYEKCLKLLPSSVKHFLTSDRFCAGSEKGASVQPGDSGGGLMFLEKNHYFIRGILALKIHGSWTALFTDLNKHVDWMLSVRNEVENDVIIKQTTVDFKTKPK
ncbi:modular serine protease-like [Planococcus citri]|uniref:modular serine protease-like n=1 Tax=Planococcus citri TaxID=170843 RepID=UPI0031F8FCBB